MKIYVFRHGTSESGNRREEGKGSEAGLTDEGRRQVRNISRAAKGLAVSPTVIFTSPLTRAVQSAEVARDAEWQDTEVRLTDALLPDARPIDVYALLDILSAADSAVLVTHYPLLRRLLVDMLGCDADIEVQNGAIVHVEFKGKPSASSGTLKWLLPQMG